MTTITTHFIAPENTPRYLFALPLAAALTLALFVGMQSLIANRFQTPDEINFIAIKDIVLPEPPTVTTQYERPQRVEVAATPTILPTRIELPGDTRVTLPPMDGPIVEPQKNPNIDFDSGLLVKQVMVPPVYPRTALANGTEGFVDVQFIVSAIGTTQEITVVNAEPKNVFDRAELKAGAGWRYRPVTKNGQPVASNPVTERIRFTIEK